MSVALGLYAEFTNENARDQFYDRFPASNFPLLTGGTIDWKLERWLPSCGWPSLSAHSFDLPDQGILSVKSAVDHTALGFKLFHLLHGASDLFFARVGFEASIFSSSELDTFIDAASRHLTLTDCVLSVELYEKLGCPLGLVKFNSDCYWTQWQGVSYEPLYGEDETELREFVEGLFPGRYFQG